MHISQLANTATVLQFATCDLPRSTETGTRNHYHGPKKSLPKFDPEDLASASYAAQRTFAIHCAVSITLAVQPTDAASLLPTRIRCNN